MVAKLIQFSIRQRWLVLLGVVALAALGVYSYNRLPIDAVPDITNVQVQINTEAKGLSPLEVEQRITFPVETAMAGIPGLDYTRSLSKYGLSQVTVVFKDGTDIYFARNLLNERLGGVKDQLPPGAEPRMGPIATGLGEIYYYRVEADKDARTPEGQPYTPTDLRTIQDWVIKPQLRNVPGVAEVNAIGGFEKQYHVTPRPERLVAYGLSLRDIVEALEKNNASAGAGYIERNGEQFLARVPGQVANVGDIEEIIVGSSGGVPIRIRDVAEVAIGQELRTGAATHDGKEVVLATAIMLLGENSRTVSARVDEKVKEINRTLPAGVKAVAVYNRTNLVDATIATVQKNLLEGALLVVVVLFPFAGQLPRRAADGSRHPAFHAFHHHGHGGRKSQRQPDEFGRARLRDHRGWCRHHRGKLPASAGGGPAPSRQAAQARRDGSRRCLTPPRKSSVRASLGASLSWSSIFRSSRSRASRERCSCRWRSPCSPRWRARCFFP